VSFQKHVEKLGQTHGVVSSQKHANFVKSVPMNPWHALFAIFPRYYITYNDSMHWFSNFSILFVFLLLTFEI
jgi:hypothetical protein